ncbi:MAG TPA: phage protein Gp27 family protein, partial [Tepidisphaeraceae bacterium]|nr:phage protein Gp27 family protein [Tepidisphaeraceae bacterium]
MMPVHYNVHKLLSAEDLAALEDFARHPARTVDECHEWAQARGYVIGRTAIYKWKKNFNLRDRFSASNETALAIMDAAKNGGTAAVSDAAMTQLAQVIFEKMISLDPAQVNTKDLWSLSAALRNLVQGK